MIEAHKLYYAIFPDSTFIVSFTGYKKPYDGYRDTYGTETFISLIWNIEKEITTLNPNGKNEFIVEKSPIMKKLKLLKETDLIDKRELIKALLSSVKE